MKIKFVFLLVVAVIIISCSKNKVQDAEYPLPVIYLSQAAKIKHSGVVAYKLPSNIHNQVINFTIAGNNFVIPVGVVRSGLDLKGETVVNFLQSAVNDPKLYGANSEQLPADKITIPSNVTFKSGEGNTQADLNVNLDFLVNSFINTPEKEYVTKIDITTNAANAQLSPDMSSVILQIDPKVIIMPVANFTSYIFNDTKTANFVNVSLNATAFEWDFGDGSAKVTDASPSHNYSAAGSYTVTLKVKGVSNLIPVAVKTTIVTII